MNIVICGLQGTGKTTLSKMLVGKYKFNYINDYKILEGGKSKSKIIDFINNHDNYVVDLCYSISSKDATKLQNSLVYFLGFVTKDPKELFKLMEQKGKNIVLRKIKANKTKSKKYQKECKKFGIPFFDVNEDRQVILDKIMLEIDYKIPN